jgi:membrane protein
VRPLLDLLRRTLMAAIDDGQFAIAKGAAYSALLSMFPVLASSAALLVEFNADYVQRILTRFLSAILPPGTEGVVLDQFRYQGQRPRALLTVAAVFALWAASSVVKSLIDGFNAAYRVPQNRSILWHSVVGILLVLIALVPLLGATSLILFGGTLESTVLGAMRVDPDLSPLAPGWVLLWRVVRFGVAFGATVVLTAILYYFGPYRKQRWLAVWPGAFLATILWLLATLGFGWYVRNVTNYNLIYGSVGTSMALLVWMYLLALIALVGCEFNAERERMVGADSRRAGRATTRRRS